MSRLARPSRLLLHSLACVIVLLIFFVWFAFRPSKYDGDPTLVITRSDSKAEMYAQIRGGPPFMKPLWKRYYQLYPPPAGTYSFPISVTNACSIHGLLIQCFEVSGVQFIIDRNVAAGSVEFGHANVLNGPQWVSAFTNALQTGAVEWWDSKKGGFRKENPVFIPAGRKEFLVLPRERLPQFR